MDIKMNKSVFLGVGAVCLVLLALGVFALVQQYSFIEGITNITSYVPWGLYISLFLFFEAVGAGVFSVLLVLGTAIMFCSIPGKLGWESPAEIAISLVQMAVAGCAIALLLGAVTGAARNVIVKLAGALLIANAAIMLGEGMLLVYRNDFVLRTFEAVMFGSYAWIFWTHVVAGIVVPAALLLLDKGVTVAAGLALAGVLLSKFVYVVRGIYPTYGEISEGLFIPFLQPSTGPQMVNVYVPSVSEFMVAGAVVGLAVLLVMVAFNSKLVPADDAGEQA